MPHTITEEDGIIIITLKGSQTYEDIFVLGEVLSRHVRDGAIAKTMVDIRHMGYPDSSARKEAMSLALRYHYVRVAVLRGESSLNTALVLFIARQSGRVREIRVFSSKKDAIRWLREEP